MYPSSLTPTRSREVSADQAGDLLRALRSVPDPRRDGGRRHPMAYVLGVLVMSFTCAGFGSFAASAQWAAAASARLLLTLGAAPDPLTGAVVAPSEATLRRIATRMDNEAFEAVLAAWTARLVSAEKDGPRLAVAIDGKAVRGARVGDLAAPHLLSAATHHTPVVLAQREIPGKTNEIPMVTTLLDDLRTAGHDPSRMVFTLDALHTQHATARLLHGADAGYVMTVKGNQPGLLAAVQAQVSAANQAPVRARSRGHARTAERLIQVAPATGIDFPGAARIFRIVRYTGGLDGQRVRKEVVYGITNLTTDQASDSQLAALIRGHWSIGNSIHYVRDVTFGEDASRVRTGNAPAVLAAIRNIATTALRLSGAGNIAAARRAATLDPTAAIQLFSRSRNQDKSSL